MQLALKEQKVQLVQREILVLKVLKADKVKLAQKEILVL